MLKYWLGELRSGSAKDRFKKKKDRKGKREKKKLIEGNQPANDGQFVNPPYLGKWLKGDNYRYKHRNGEIKSRVYKLGDDGCRYFWVLMESDAAGVRLGAAEDVYSTTLFSRWSHAVSRRYQHLLDRCTPYIFYRWIACFFVASIYVLRVYLIEGFYIVSYGLGIYILNLLIGFLSPQVDPEILDLHDGPALPLRESDEFRPFVRRLPEFKFWCVQVSDCLHFFSAHSEFELS